MSFDVKAWLKQTSTVHGIAGLAGLVVGIGVYYGTRSGPDAIMASGFAVSSTLIALNDSTQDPSALEKLVGDAVTAVTQKRVAQMIPTIAGDVQAVLSSVAAAPPAPQIVVAPVVQPVTLAPVPPAPPAA